MAPIPCRRLLFIDTGCGIANSRLPLIFERFYSYPVHNGSGIGLALCRQIVHCLAGAHPLRVARACAYAIFILEFPQPLPARFQPIFPRKVMHATARLHPSDPDRIDR